MALQVVGGIAQHAAEDSDDRITWLISHLDMALQVVGGIAQQATEDSDDRIHLINISPWHGSPGGWWHCSAGSGGQ